MAGAGGSSGGRGGVRWGRGRGGCSDEGSEDDWGKTSDSGISSAGSGGVSSSKTNAFIHFLFIFLAG